MTAARRTCFSPIPDDPSLALSWPTPNRHLHAQPERYFAATRVNQDYGLPGWTRDCGDRFHHGCDIAPVHVTPTGVETVVLFSDCDTGAEFESREPTFVPHDDVYAVHNGRVEEVCDDPRKSDFGNHIVIAHPWPRHGECFYSLYGHLAAVHVVAGQSVASGERIGIMGTTSRSADAQNWMAVAPHLHFEVWDALRNPMDPAAFLRRYLTQASS